MRPIINIYFFTIIGLYLLKIQALFPIIVEKYDWVANTIGVLYF